MTKMSARVETMAVSVCWACSLVWSEVSRGFCGAGRRATRGPGLGAGGCAKMDSEGGFSFFGGGGGGAFPNPPFLFPFTAALGGEEEEEGGVEGCVSALGTSVELSFASALHLAVSREPLLWRSPFPPSPHCWLCLRRPGHPLQLRLCAAASGESEARVNVEGPQARSAAVPAVPR